MGSSHTGQPLATWLKGRETHSLVASWKNEEGTIGPLLLFDRTEADADPKAVAGFGVPYGSTYRGNTGWMSKAEAQRWATELGARFAVTFKGE